MCLELEASSPAQAHLPPPPPPSHPDAFLEHPSEHTLQPHQQEDCAVQQQCVKMERYTRCFHQALGSC